MKNASGLKADVMGGVRTRGQFYFFAFLFMTVYLASYLTRINYGAVLTEMLKDTGFAKDQLSLPVTLAFITYGAGQVVSGIFGDIVQPKRLIAGGLIVTAAMNLLIPFCTSLWQFNVVWAINGLAQAFMWPPIVRLTIFLFPDERDYRRAYVIVSCGSTGGTLLLYALSPVVIAYLGGWRGVFFIGTVCAVAVACIVLLVCAEVPVNSPHKAHHNNIRIADATQQPRSSGLAGLFAPVMLLLMITIILQGMLRDGVTTWMPTYIDDTFHLGSGLSILTGVFMPIFGILCTVGSSYLYGNWFRTPPLAAGVFWLIGLIVTAVLVLSGGQVAFLSVMCLAILSGATHGVNSMMTTMVPPFFRKGGNVATVSGVLNACTYIGSAVATYGVGLLCKRYGWDFTLKTWLVIVAVGTVICAVAIPLWNRKFGKGK